jgi:hypothetical protein
MNKVGIAIIDVYEQDNLDSCYNSIPKDIENVIVISNTRNKLPDCEKYQFSGNIPFATLRSRALHNFRIKGLTDYFLINSNQVITDSNIFAKTIHTSNVFGIGLFCGPSEFKMSIEDDENNITLHLSEKINSDFIYLNSDIVSKVGFFDDRYFNTKSLDVLDYIMRLRNEKMYPPTGFVAYIPEGSNTTKGSIQKPSYKELNDPDQSINMSYGYFLTQYNYIPTQNDPQPASNDELMGALEHLQKNYAKKI